MHRGLKRRSKEGIISERHTRNVEEVSDNFEEWKESSTSVLWRLKRSAHHGRQKLRAEERGAWYFDVSDKETLLSGEIEIEDWRNYHLAVETWYVNVKRARTEEADGVGRT
jgi:hypothetical protein